MLILLLFVAALIVGFLWCRIHEGHGARQRRQRRQGDRLDGRVDIDAAARALEGIHGRKLLIHIYAPPL